MGRTSQHGRQKATVATPFAAMRQCMLGFALSILVFPANADVVLHPILSAVVAACGNGPDDVRKRLETLAAAGLVIAGESKREEQLRYLREHTPGYSSDDPDEMLRFFTTAGDNAFGRPRDFPPGSALDPDATLRILSNKGSVYSDLVAKDASISLWLLISEDTSTLTDDFGISCRFSAPDPVPADFLEMLATAGSRVLSMRSTPSEGLEWRRFENAGRRANVVFYDMTKFPEFLAMPARAGSDLRASAIVRVDILPVLLADSKPRFRKVTP